MPSKILAMGAMALAALSISSAAMADDPTYNGTSIKTVTSTVLDSTGATVGSVQLDEDAAGAIQVSITLEGLPAGPHGVHFHAVGVCEGPGFTTAGGHFNPGALQHGLDNPAGAHAGDLEQIPESFDGSDTHVATTDRISLTGGTTYIGDADGTAMVIHAAADDQVTDPTGNSGARIACAVVAAPQAPPATAVPSATPQPPSAGTGSSIDSGGSFFGTAAGLFAISALAAALLGAAALRRRS
ncbi:MAG: superoxide dismutase family protein [Dehalococcoidia bacterium]